MKASFESVNCNHLNDSYHVVLSDSTVFEWNPKLWPFQWKSFHWTMKEVLILYVTLLHLKSSWTLPLAFVLQPYLWSPQLCHDHYICLLNSLPLMWIWHSSHHQNNLSFWDQLWIFSGCARNLVLVGISVCWCTQGTSGFQLQDKWNNFNPHYFVYESVLGNIMHHDETSMMRKYLAVFNPKISCYFQKLEVKLHTISNVFCFKTQIGVTFSLTWSR